MGGAGPWLAYLDARDFAPAHTGAPGRTSAGGLLPQWRARAEPSRRVAGALGFREADAQVSILVRR
ncbi:hypothetical protein B1L11_40455 [Microbispora sp. GKU 823]|nr:hypothetical protein B1L11_40455 [Microbispora sp. GKU 823]